MVPFTKIRKTGIELRSLGFSPQLQRLAQTGFASFNGFKTINQGLYTDIKKIKVGQWSTAIKEKVINIFMIQKKKLAIHGDYETGTKHLCPKYF